MKMLHFDKSTGEILGFYSPEIHGANIPQPSVEVTDEQWRDCLANPGRRRVMVAGAATRIESHDPPAPPLEDVKAERIQRVKSKAFRLLQPTDWYVIRSQETGAEIPKEVAAYRAQVRAATDQAEASLEAMTDAADVLAYEVAWP